MLRTSYVYGPLGRRLNGFLDYSGGWWAATVASYCPSRMVEHPKSKATQPGYSNMRVTMYNRQNSTINVNQISHTDVHLDDQIRPCRHSVRPPPSNHARSRCCRPPFQLAQHAQTGDPNSLKYCILFESNYMSQLESKLVIITALKASKLGAM